MKITESIEAALSRKEILSDDPTIKAAPQAFWIKAFDLYFSNMAKKAFYSIRIKNAQNFNLRDKTKGNIIFSNHNCWWDGPVGFLLSKKRFKTQLYMMIEELHRFPLLSRLGAFSVEKDCPHSSMKALNYSAKLLQNPNSSLWIYPEGIVKPPDFRPIKFASGISYICKKLNGVNLIPVANKYNFLREDRPEVLLDVGKPIILNDNAINRKEFTSYLENEFTKLLDNQKEEISSGNINEYEYLFKNQLCIYKLIEKHLTFLPRHFIT